MCVTVCVYIFFGHIAEEKKMHLFLGRLITLIVQSIPMTWGAIIAWVFKINSLPKTGSCRLVKITVLNLLKFTNLFLFYFLFFSVNKTMCCLIHRSCLS